MAAGVNVAFGHDCVMDPWYGMGSGDMLEVAHMGLHVAQMTSQKGIRACFEAVTTNAAKVMHLEGYGLAPGCDASFVLLQARRCDRGDPAAGEPPEGVAQGAAAGGDAGSGHAAARGAAAGRGVVPARALSSRSLCCLAPPVAAQPTQWPPSVLRQGYLRMMPRVVHPENVFDALPSHPVVHAAALDRVRGIHQRLRG